MDPAGGISGRTQVLAHRGYHASGISENSLRAFEAAINLGADALELDVRRTRDGVLVVHHDAELADGRRIDTLDFAQLPALPDGQPVPTLLEVAELARTRGARLAVELKEGGYEELALRQLASRMPLDQVEVISFSRDRIRRVEALSPAVRTGLLEPQVPGVLRGTPVYTAALWVMDRLDWHPSLDAAARIGADYVTVEQRVATPKFLAAARERGIAVDVWTVNDPVRIAELLGAGIQGVVTDRPDLALALRDGRAA